MSTAKWIEYVKGAGAAVGVVAATMVVPLAGWLVTSEAASQRRLDVVEERTRDLDTIRDTLQAMAVDVSAIRARNETRDEEVMRRLEHIEEQLATMD